MLYLIQNSGETEASFIYETDNIEPFLNIAKKLNEGGDEYSPTLYCFEITKDDLEEYDESTPWSSDNYVYPEDRYKYKNKTVVLKVSYITAKTKNLCEV